jgi:RNA polymerase sigma-70 factor (ECF subfamily)
MNHAAQLSTWAPSDEPDANVAELLGCRTALLEFATYLTGNRSDALDLVQDVFERALRGQRASRAPGKALAWMRIVLRNLFLDQRRAADARLVDRAADDKLLVRLPSPEPEERPRWEAVSDECLARCLDRLDPTLREAYELSAVFGLSQKEVAARLHISPATVGTRLFRARRRLRALLCEEGIEGAPLDE